MASIFPEETLRQLREKLEILPVIKLINYRLDTVHELGDTIKCFCPIHREAVFRTLIIDRRTRRYRCSYSLCPGHKGGDLIDLYARSNEIEYDEAVRQLVEKLSIAIDLPPAEDYIQKTLEVSENYLTLRALEEAEQGFQKVLSVQPGNIAALKGMLEIHKARNEQDQWLEVLGRLAAALLEEKKFSEAAAAFRQLLEKRPEDAKARLQYVECLIGQGERERALEEYMRLADFYETRQEFDKALEVYRKIEGLNLDIIDVYPHIIQLMVASDRASDAVEETLRKATEHERKGEYERALECYRYVLEIDETRADVREKFIDTAIVAGLDEGLVEQCLDLVEAYIGEQSYASANRALEKLRQAAPGHLGVLEKQVEVLRREGRDADAVAVLLELADRLLDLGRLDEARAHMRSVGSAVDLDIDLLRQLGQAQRRCGLIAEGTEALLAAVERLEAQEKLDEAAGLLETVVEMNPTDASLSQKLIDLCAKAGLQDKALDRCASLAERAIAESKWDEAEVAIERGLQLNPNDTRIVEFQARVLTAKGLSAEAEGRYITLAREHMAARQWDEARRALLKALAIDPDHAQAALMLADVGKQLGDTRHGRDHLRRLVRNMLDAERFKEAEVLLRKLHEIAPDDQLALVQLATVYEGLGEQTKLLETYRTLVELYVSNEAYPKALEYCTAILKHDSENIWALEQMVKIYEKIGKTRSVPQICLRLAQIYEKLDDFDQVQQCYQRALDLDPGNVDARIEYTRFLIGLRRYESASQQAQLTIRQLSEQERYREAIQLGEELLEQAPDDVELRRALIELCRQGRLEREFVAHCTQLINLHYRRGEFAEVVELYRKLLEREPENVTFRTHLIDALLRLKRREEAIEQYFRLASLYLERENYEDAENTLVELLDQSPGNPRALEMLIDILIENGRYEQAVQRIRELSEIYVGVGKNDKAVEVLRRVLAFDPDNREIRRRIAEITREGERLRESVQEMAQKAAQLWEKGDLAEAVEAQRQVVRLRPEDTVARRRLAEMLANRGESTAAVGELVQVARIRTEQGEYEQALKAVDEVLERDPTNHAARRLRAEIFAKMGDQKRALEEFMNITAEMTPAVEAGRSVEPPAPAFPTEPLKVVPEFTFDNFVVGEPNRFAYATAMAVAKAPAVHYNPVFLYSDVGLGKTHLISAIANYIAQHEPQLRVLYTSAEEFASQLVQAIQNNTVNAFRNRYKAADVLLVDDVHFLAGKERTQEEFFHIFNALFQSKRQIVITSDRPPKDIARLEKRLKSRFGSGVIVDIQPPDFETRMAILKKELERHDDVEIDDRLLNLVAEEIQSNVRELKAALNQILVKHQLSGAEVTEQLVRQVLEIYKERE